MRVLQIIAGALFAIALPAALFTSSIAAIANHLGFEKYGIGDTTGLSQTELRKVADGLVSYFNSDEEYINITVARNGESFVLFNEREVMHLKDVKGLIQLDYKVLVGALAYLLAYTGVQIWRRQRRHTAQAMVGGAGLTLALMLALGIGSLLNFDQLWLQFHFLSFANELWRLDPAKDYLIMLFPQGFFYDYALLIGGVSIGIAVVVGGVGWRLLRKSRAHTLQQ